MHTNSRLMLAAGCVVALLLAACGPRLPAASPPAATASGLVGGPATPRPGSASGSPRGSPSGSATAALTPVSGTAITVSRGPVGQHSVLLTFDAGADTGFAAQILGTLEGAGVSATFGVTGRWAEQNPDLVHRMVADGDIIVNHTYDHRSFTGHSTHTGGLSPDQRIAEIEQADQALSSISGQSIKPWFRLPYGDGDPAVAGQVAQAGYRYLLGWTLDSLGWFGLPAPAISQRCLKAAAPGTIYLFHVGSRSQDAVALPGIIQALKAQGYGFLTAAQLTP